MDVGRWAGVNAPWILKFDILLLHFSVEKCFTLSFGVGKIQFRHCCPLPEKNPSDAHESTQALREITRLRCFRRVLSCVAQFHLQAPIVAHDQIYWRISLGKD